MAHTIHVALIATECFPFVKVGGLADVVGALPREFEAQGAQVEIVIPRPADLDSELDLETLAPALFSFRGTLRCAEAHCVRLPESPVRVFLIGGEGYFPRAGLYVDPATGSDYPDQLDRWVFFQHAALSLLARESPDLDILHCHEHQTALVPFYLDSVYRPAGSFDRTATVFTIHNLGYQGMFPADQWEVVGLDAHEIRPGGALEYFGQINLMKGGIVAADALTVVSPTYAKEIQTEEGGCGLESVIAERHEDLFGIVNGIDLTVWNPRTDSMIPATYSADDFARREINRARLLEHFAIADNDPTWPVLAMISRIDYQKGFDLVLVLLEQLLERSVYFLLLGTGDRTTEQSLETIIRRHRDRAAASFGFDDGLAHRMIAGSDMLLMPSRYEPCGLTQMYALQYGTVPVAHATGGLADTIQEFDPETGTGTGFLFSGYDPPAFRDAIDRAMTHWMDQDSWRRIQTNGMAKDFGWEDSARRYLTVFETTLGKKLRTLDGST